MINANLVFQRISNNINTKANHVSHGQHANNAMNVIFSILLFSLGNLVEMCMVAISYSNQHGFDMSEKWPTLTYLHVVTEFICGELPFGL